MNERLELVCKSPDETRCLGEAIGRALTAGTIVALNGDLGTGKTTLTQGIARGLDVPETFAVTSPTFTLVNEYPGRLTLYHVDLYRLGGAADLEALGYEEFFFADGVTVVEWSEKIAEVLDEGCIFIDLRYIDAERRSIGIRAPASLVHGVDDIWKGGIK
ncbi:MAG TPA: tRNA (adenosine(37)-N6)-threonylcarbamoyltransferase complex ATPase subunit type 1 TsaE [Syntrophus sp. (in: bacteria)]|nr:tRNA (adenosine(37)-N6)-threonylcarbamoyltransferase complex ATPase subunit type 1 TsaE [Syntrophus sp. (in: bacteria)]